MKTQTLEQTRQQVKLLEAKYNELQQVELSLKIVFNVFFISQL